MLKKGELDLVAGGPPCQGFSINAPIRSQGDQRNHLFWHFLDFVEEFRPKTVLIENVPGMVSFESGETVRSIQQSLKNLGYNVTVRILFAANFGVPQMRWRTIFLATRENFGAKALFPIPTHTAPARANFTTSFDGDSLILSEEYISANAERDYVSVWEAISDLPKIPNGGGSYLMDYSTPPKTQYQRMLRGRRKKLYNHQCSKLGPTNLERLPFIPPGGSWRDIPFDLLPTGMKRARRSDHTKRYGRLDPNGLASTILTKCDPHWGTYIHPKQDRVLSIREAARLQSFPDHVRFFGSMTEQYEQVGNAVPPVFARAIGEQIHRSLKLAEKGKAIPLGLGGKCSQQELAFGIAN